MDPGRTPDDPHRGVPGALAVRAWLARSAPWLIALAFYAVAAVIVTWPVAKDPTGHVFGAPGDSTGEITLLRYRNDLGVGPLSNAVTHEEDAPFGVTLPGVTSLPQLAVEGPMQLVAKVTGSAVLAYNLAVLLGIALSAFCCFLLCRHVTGNVWAAGVAGVAYGFNPWILERASGHVHFTHLWSLALVALGLLMIHEGAARRGWPLFGAATVVGLYTNTYFALFIGVILAAFIVADVGSAIVHRRSGPVRPAFVRGGIAVGIYVVALIPQAIVSISQRSAIDTLLQGTRSAEDRLVYGARWYEWIVPSDRHPVFDTWTAPFRLSHLHLSNPSETVIYLGVTVLALALVGAVVAVLARKRQDGRLAWAALFAGCAIVLGVIVSAPSRVPVAGVEVPMPSAALGHIVDPWRVYARLFAVVALGVAILAAIGTAALLRRLPVRTWPAVAAALTVLVAFDLAARHTTFATQAPPIYGLLARQPGDAPRVEYPLLPPASGRHLAYIFYTQAAHRPLFNGGRLGTLEASIQGRMSDPSRNLVAPALAALGVRWAVIHADAYPAGQAPAMGKGFRLVGRSTTDSLWRVIAAPAPAIAVPDANFGGVEPADGGRAMQWLQASSGTLTVLNPGRRELDVALEFTVASFARPRSFTIRDGDRVLARKRAAAAPVPVRIRVRVAPGATHLQISTPTPPEAIAKVLHSPDPRSVSLQVSDIAVRDVSPVPGA